MEIRPRTQLNQIGIKDVGEEMQVMARDARVAEDEENLGVEEGTRW